jgi:hypothetical protein
MKVRLPKSYAALPQSEKDIINEVMTEEVEKEVNKNMAELQKLWLQFACIVLHRNFGFGKERCLLFLANWREMYRTNNRLKDKAEQTVYLTANIDKIFGKGGYPQEYMDKLEDLK